MSETATLHITSQSVDDTVALGRKLGEQLAAGDIVCLSGNLGAGKTAFTRGIGTSWGSREPITSPTFTLIHEHRRAQDAQILYHIDCYRLHSAEEAWGIGLEDLLHSDGISVLEWPENIAGALPAERLWIDITFLDDTQRELAVHANGVRYMALLNALREDKPDETG